MDRPPTLTATFSVAFLLLVLGLWSAVLAIATPGTGLPAGVAPPLKGYYSNAVRVDAG